MIYYFAMDTENKEIFRGSYKGSHLYGQLSSLKRSFAGNNGRYNLKDYNAFSLDTENMRIIDLGNCEEVL